MSAHIVARHVQGRAECDDDTSFFTDETGQAITDWEKAVDILIEATRHITLAPSNLTKNKRTVESGKLKIRTMPIDPLRKESMGFAVTWGEQTGDDGGKACTWVVLFLSSKMVTGRYPWVTAFPATQSFIDRKALK